MHKIIISNLEINLSDKKLSISEENSWFSDAFFTKYSYPFDVTLSDEISNLFGDLISSDSISGSYKLPCAYMFYDKIEAAELVVESISNKTASLSIQYGMDEFPNFEKNLAELNLFTTEVIDIYAHANQVIRKRYPEVNYNFPMVHTEKYNPEDILYFGFEKVINKRAHNTFVKNEVENNVMLNRNIIQPMPYLMYVLKRGFELSGRQLEGDILQDSILSDMLIFSEKEYVSRIDSAGTEILLDHNNIEDSWSFIDKIGYSGQKKIVVTEPGYYNLIGDINIGLVEGANTGSLAYMGVRINGTLVFSQFAVKIRPVTYLVDSFFDLQPGHTAVIDIVFQSNIYETSPLVDLQVLPVYFYDAQGNKMTNLVNSNKIDLNRSVPDMTFGSLFTTIMNWFNYDVDEITDTKVVINKINNSFRNNEVIDLSQFENLSVQTKIEQDNSFILKYQEDGEVDLGGVYVDSSGVLKTTKDFNKNAKHSIEINAFYLQNETINSIRTAKSNQSAEDKLCVILYDWTYMSDNIAKDPIELTMMNICDKYHYEWFQNRVQGISTVFSFVTNIENIVDLNTKKRVYAYNNIHLCKRIEKVEISPDIYEVEIETEKLMLK